MHLELTLDEARILEVAVEHIHKDKGVMKTVFAGYEDDIRTFVGVAGRLRGLYEKERQKPNPVPNQRSEVRC